MSLATASFISILALSFSIALGSSLQRHRAALTEMHGMMVGMTLGMMTGLLVGTVWGAATDMFISNLVGLGVGVALGVGFGRLGGLMGILDGGMAGVMGGMMGAMLGVMVNLSALAVWMTVAVMTLLYGAALLGVTQLVRQAATRHTAYKLRQRMERHTGPLSATASDGPRPMLACHGSAVEERPLALSNSMGLTNALFFRALNKYGASDERD